MSSDDIIDAMAARTAEAAEARAVVRARLVELSVEAARVVVASIDAGDFEGADMEKAEILAIAARMRANDED